MTACSLVCRRWRALSRSPALWRQQALRYTPDDALARQHFCRVLRLAPCLGRLDLGPAGRGSRAMPQYVVKAALETACVLRKLRVVAKGMDADFVMQLLRRHGPNLEELDLTTSVEVDARDALAAVDGMGLVGLRLAGRFDEEYNFGPRKIGAPRRALEVGDPGRAGGADPGADAALTRH
ncbi:hypothetical protein ONE63_001562 [Megalurothrips usitatus]|uniref:F-box domain-containing protein n=1 Tax=Megalurothrips usitatus TaxID=439358 RepID=A0AAV7XCH3_9NEOP|nr:hypothetical protein ONE63_001562 [Megalurothrips usitatus]